MVYYKIKYFLIKNSIKLILLNGGRMYRKIIFWGALSGIALGSFLFVVLNKNQPKADIDTYWEQVSFSGRASSETHTINWPGDNWNKYESIKNIKFTGTDSFKFTGSQAEFISSKFSSGGSFFFSVWWGG